MTILQGEHYCVQTLDQFIERTSFDTHDVLEAIEQSDLFEEYTDIVSMTKDLYGDDGDEILDGVESIADIPDADANEFLGAYNIDTNVAIRAVLQQDDRDWTHLFDGYTHDIVQIYDCN